MASLKRKSLGSAQASRELKVQKPFISPLRNPEASKISSPGFGHASKSPLCPGNYNSPQNDTLISSLSSNPASGQSEEQHTLNDNQEVSSSNCVTPRKIATSQITSIRQRKISPRQFSVPFRSPVNSSTPANSFVSKEEQLNKLLSYECELDKEIATLKELGFKMEELKGHIENLHKYNETKDSAQLVLGRLAELEGITIKEMHEKYDVPTDE